MKMTQQEFNATIAKAVSELIKIVQDAGYVYKPGMDESKGHEHITIAKNLYSLQQTINAVRESLTEKK